MQTDDPPSYARLIRIRDFSDRVPGALAIGASVLLLSLAVWVDWLPLGSRVAFPLYHVLALSILAWFAGWIPALAATIASAIMSAVGVSLAGPALRMPLVFLLGRILTFALACVGARASAIGRHMLTYFLLGDQIRARTVPIRIGLRRVSPPPREPNAGSLDSRLGGGLVKLLIRPGMSFGTGTHASTQMCLKLLADLVEPSQVVFDLGSGSGILSIAAAKLGATTVVAADIDPVAEQATRANIELNQVGDTVQFRRGSWHVFLDPPSNETPGLGHSPSSSSHIGDVPKADLLVANILTPVHIEALKEGLTRCVRPGGKLILSGIRLEEWDEIHKELDEAELAVVERREMNEWLAVVATKPEGAAPADSCGGREAPGQISSPSSSRGDK
jgi:ribosomal protein L11 methylase PrmA